MKQQKHSRGYGWGILAVLGSTIALTGVGWMMNSLVQAAEEGEAERLAAPPPTLQFVSTRDRGSVCHGTVLDSSSLITWEFDSALAHLAAWQPQAFPELNTLIGDNVCVRYLSQGQEPSARPMLLKTPTPLEERKWELKRQNELWQAVEAKLPEAAEFPELHPQARLAKVPILMYHDIVPEKEVFFDVTPEELEAHFQYLKEIGATPVSLGAVIAHLRTGAPLPEKPVVLTFDDGYRGHYTYVYPLLKKYGYPATFSIYTNKMKQVVGRVGVTWEHLQEMSRDPLVTIASHSVTHADDLRKLDDAQLRTEIFESKQILEERLGIPIQYFTYPVGHSDERVEAMVSEAGYLGALSMDDNDEHFANESPNLLKIGRFGQSRLEQITPEAWGGHPLPRKDGGFDFQTRIHKAEYEVDGVGLILITGGRPETIHADTRYQLPEMLEGTDVVAAVDGAFFSLKYLDSNVLIGPALSRQGTSFAPGNPSENPLLNGRPLVLIARDRVDFIPFDADLHNTVEGIKAEMPDVTDAFVGAAWLVKDSQPRKPEEFGDLFDFDAARHRAFWGINQAGQPVIGVSKDLVGSVELGEMLASLGFREAVMLDSGGSTSLAYEGESLVGYLPRPVPHAVVLYAPE